MRNRGQRNRFGEDVKQFWLLEAKSCHVCEMNQPEVLHHINAPSCGWFIDGAFVASILNSAPVHNYTHPSASQFKAQGASGVGIDSPCHVGNESWLYTKENAMWLMQKTARILEMCEYRLKPLDEEFISQYSFMYDRKKVPSFIRQLLEEEPAK